MSTTTDKVIQDQIEEVDVRFRAAGFLRRNMKKVFPDHWSFLLGEIALYSFVVLILTGIYLTLFFKPSSEEVIYHGSYEKLQGVHMTEAYASTLDISFDIVGGLLMRQIHHWSALIFVAAIAAHMMRIFFTGAFRRPRETNWLIGVVLFLLAITEGFAGYSLPDDLLSGTGLRIAHSFMLSIPVIGTYVVYFVFGGNYPGTDFIPRLYSVHILLLPGIMLALITAHMLILWHQKHTQFPGKGRTNANVVGQPFYPVFLAKTGAFFLLVFGATALLSTIAQINPIWLYGPYSAANVSAGAQPDWYFGWIEGAMRIMPPIETVLGGYVIGWNLFIPAILLMGAFFTIAALYPFFERLATGDRREHHLLDRPRNAPTRTAIGVSVVTFYGLLWAAGGNDIISHFFDISLNATTWFFRVTVIVLPILAFWITRRVCLGLQNFDKETAEHGVESGIIQRLPSGEYIEVTRTIPEDERERIASKEPARPLTAARTDGQGVPPPGSRGLIGKMRGALNRFYTADDVDVVPEETRRELEQADERHEELISRRGE